MDKSGKSTLIGLLKPYRGVISILLVLALLGNGLNLVIPKIIQKGIDDYNAHTLDLRQIVIWFALASIAIFVLSYFENVFDTYVSEKVARDLRLKLSSKVSSQDYNYIRKHSSARLLTNITSDVDGVKLFISRAIVSIISSGVLITGAAILLLNINFRLGLIVLIMIPVIISSFLIIFKKLKTLFRKTQEVMDWLNRVINENIMGAALVRVLNSRSVETRKFTDASSEAKGLGLSVVKLFSTLIPIIVLTESMAELAVLGVGGRFIIMDNMTLGEFAAFTSYISILVFPLLLIGFTSNIIARSAASYQRIREIMDEEVPEETGTIESPVTGNIEVDHISLTLEEHKILKDVSFRIKAGNRTAIIGPTAAGKTQLLNILSGLYKPTEGTIYFDRIGLDEYRLSHLLKQIGIVFQDSIIFNLTLRENIAFNKHVSNEELEKAIATAELKEFVNQLPQGLDSIISERGGNLSGGQKQRIMLARALAINPTILLLDDFTARVDVVTEKKISENLKRNYPELTLISVTQKIEPVKNYDQIILLMEGEVIATGTHDALIGHCPEYIQIYQSQQSLTDVEEKI